MKKNWYRAAAAILAAVLTASSLSAVSYATESNPVTEEATALSQEAEDPGAQGSTGQNATEEAANPADEADTGETGAAGGEETGAQENAETPGAEQTPGTQDGSDIPSLSGGDATDTVILDEEMPAEEETDPEEVLIEEETEVVTEEALAAGAEIVASGSCGASATWTLERIDGSDAAYRLVIDGTGSMEDCKYDSALKYKGGPYSWTGAEPAWRVYQSNIKELTVSSGITRIGSFAFAGLKKLETVTIEGERAIRLGEAAFAECASLRSVTLYAIDWLEEQVFHDTPSLQQITLTNAAAGRYDVDNGVLYQVSNGGSGSRMKNTLCLYPAALASCTSYTVPEGVFEIAAGAFSGNKFLQSVTLPQSITRIGECAFAKSSIVSAEIPGSVMWMGAGAYLACERLQSVSLSVSPPDYAFYQCRALASVTFTGSAAQDSIGESAFSGCSALTAIALPDSVRMIGDYAFDYCTALEAITLPKGLAAERLRAFDGCKSLKTLSVPGGISVFYVPRGCDALGEIVIEDGVETVLYPWGDYKDPSMKRMVIPVSVTEIKNLFGAFSAIETVVYAGTEKMWNTVKKTGDISALSRITVEYGNAGAYKITFDANGDGVEGEMAPVFYEPDARVTLPKNTFARKDYVFQGWNTKNDGKGTAYKDGATLKSNGSLTLYAQWTPLSYLIRYNGNGAASGSMKDQEMVPVYASWNAAYQTLRENAFKRPGYVFTGWNTKKDGTGDAVSDPAALHTRARHKDVITLYAQWKEVPYTITYVPREGDKSASGLRYRLELPEGAPEEYVPTKGAVLPAVQDVKVLYYGNECDDHVFTGWYSDAAYTKRVTKIAAKTKGDLVLYGKIEPATYTIRFEPSHTLLRNLDNSGSWSNVPKDAPAVTGTTKAITAKSGEEVRLPACGFKRRGYVFAGWYTPDDLYGYKVCQPGETVRLFHKRDTETSAVSLYAVWTKADWTFTGFDVNGGRFEAGACAGIEAYRKYSFWNATWNETWELDAQTMWSIYGPKETVDEAIILPAGQSVKSGQMPVPVRDGFTFAGWYNTVTGKKVGALSASGWSFVRLEARWTPVAATLNFTKGNGKYVSGSVKAVKVSGEQEITLPEPGSMKARGQAFLGWKLSWTADDKLYQPGEKVIITPGPKAKTFTAAAQWQAETYTIKLHTGYATLDKESQIFQKLFAEKYEGKENPVGEVDIVIGEAAYEGTYVFDDTLKGLALPKLTTYHRENAEWTLDVKFSHWINTSTGKKVTSLPPATTTGEIALEAVWVPLRNRKVIYYSTPDGTGSSASVTVTVNEGKDYALRTTPVTKVPAGYAFLGWTDYYRESYASEDSEEERKMKPLSQEEMDAQVFSQDRTTTTTFWQTHVTGEGKLGVYRPGYVIGQQGKWWRRLDACVDHKYYPVFVKTTAGISQAEGASGKLSVSYDLAGGRYDTSAGNDAPAGSYTYAHGHVLTKQDLFVTHKAVRDGYTFKGWEYTGSDGKTKRVATGAKSLKVTQPMILKAVWQPKTVKIRFYHNVPKTDPAYKLLRGSMPVQNWSYRADDTGAKLIKNRFTLKGYTFVGWNDAQQAFPGVDYTLNGRTCFNESAPRFSAWQDRLDLYAVWKKETYTIRYEEYPGEKYISAPAIWPAGYTPETEYDVHTPTITLRAPYRHGYAFQGWYKDPKFQTKITQIKQGSTGDLTLYAKWKKLY